MYELLTTAEAAAALRLHIGSIRKLIERGQLRAVKRGRDVFISAEEVARYQRERRPVGHPRKAKG